MIESSLNECVDLNNHSAMVLPGANCTIDLYGILNYV
uniref:Uncharacterized protein n=1 Tax=Anguilla anguilla TaxID=7936 RepID=A0A0E9TFA6_ANGAN